MKRRGALVSHFGGFSSLFLVDPLRLASSSEPPSVGKELEIYLGLLLVEKTEGKFVCFLDNTLACMPG